jgi:hypothetical protein
MRGETMADRDDLAMRGRIALAASQIAAARQDMAIPHDHRAEWQIGAARLGDGDAHEAFVLGCVDQRRLERTGRGQGGDTDRARDN